MQRVNKLIKVELRPAPVLISSTIEVVRNNFEHSIRVAIYKNTEYQDIEDNTRRYLGQFSVDNFSELEVIINELAKLSNVP